MADIFMSEDVQKLLENKFVVVIGDSVMRGVYKDLVLMLQRNELLVPLMLKRKGERSHCNDRLIDIGEMTNEKSYREVRQYQTGYNLVRFYFVTACYSSYTEYIMRDLVKEPHPDVIIMNSCLWDVSRYGPASMKVYQKNLCKLFVHLSEVLQPDCLFIWTTAMPIAKTIKGGVLVPGLEFREDILRLDVIEGNFYAKQAVVAAGHDVLDFHYHFRNHVNLRERDGIHWNYRAHRTMTNFLLIHICEAWGFALPRRQRFRTIARDNAGPFRPPMRPTQIMFQPPVPEERYGGPIGYGKMQYNQDYTYASAANHHRSASCDPSYLNNADNHTFTCELGLLATNLLIAFEQNRQNNQWEHCQRGGPQRHHYQDSIVRHHPYHPHVKYNY